MRRFLTKTLFLILLVMTVLGLALFLIPNKKIPDNSLFASIDKHHRLSSLQGPKVVLVGGSNLPFGIKSQMIEDALGMPVVNMGLHAGLGMNFILSEVEKDIHKGDIVIVSLEYHHFLSRSMYNGEDVLAALLFDVNRECIQYVRPLHWIAFFPNLCLYSSKKIINLYSKKVNDFEDRFTRDSFNSYGDEVAHYGLPSSVHSGKKPALSTTVYRQSLLRLIEFRNFVESRSASFFLTACPYPEAQYSLDENSINAIADAISDAGMHCLIKPTDSLYPDSLMFNSFFHLSGEGAEFRTKQLIQALHAECQSNQN